MPDTDIFETRLAGALRRYAELAPVMDDEAIAAEAIQAGGSVRRLGWLVSLRRALRVRGGTARPTWATYLLVLLALVLAAILVAVVGGEFRDRMSPPLGGNGTIVFTENRNNHEGAFTHLVSADGSSDQSIDIGRCPSYSMDGSVLASLSYEGSSAYLVVSGTKGQPTRRILLVEGASKAVSYALSPDGTRVAWIRPDTSAAGPSASPEAGLSAPPGSGPVATGDRVELWVAPVAGGPGAPIVPVSTVPGEFYGSPVWSPDGRWIAFGSHVANATTGEARRTAIDVVAADGSTRHRVTARPGVLGDGMSWSPDGRDLVYLGLPDGAPTSSSAVRARDVFVIGADGTGDRNLTGTPAFEAQPAWSPDGRYLAFTASADGSAFRLMTFRMNGSAAVDTPAIGPETEWFVWSPDGVELLWEEVTLLGSEAYRTTLQSIDPQFREPPTTLQVVDGVIVCTPSWQRLGP